MKNIVLYGLSEDVAKEIASNYNLGFCTEFEQMGDEGGILLLPAVENNPQSMLDFFNEMEKYQHKIDAVITVQSECFSLINYCTLPWKFFSVSNSDDDQTNQQSEIAGIIETQLGMLHAHENLPELQSDNSGR